MLESFYIGSYRGLQNIKFEQFKDINIFVGMNNAGKTSVLEAMILSGLFDDGDLLIQTIVSRYQQVSIDFVKEMFQKSKEPLICLKRQMSDAQKIVHTHITYEEDQKTILNESEVEEEKTLDLKFHYKIEGAQTKGENKTLNYSVLFKQQDRRMSIELRHSRKNEIEMKIPCEFISFSRFDRTNYLMNSLDAILEQDKREALIKVLQMFDPKVQNFEVVGQERNIKIFSNDGEQPLSLYDYGNGMYKAFYIASAVLLSENGLLMIDEIEAGIHKEALRRFIAYLMEVCKEKNVQLFITTHSLETLDLFLELKSEQLDAISTYNMRKEKNETVIRRYSGNKLFELRQEMGLDIR